MDDNCGVYSYKEGCKLSMWWIDDCFTNSDLVGEVDNVYMPFNHIQNGLVLDDKGKPKSDYGQSGIVYSLLCSMADHYQLNLHLASFETAKERWNTINSKSCLVLVDIGYEDFPENCWDGDSFSPGTFGIDFVMSQLGDVEPRATIVFLTIDPERVYSWIGDRGKWLPGMSYPVRKIVKDIDRPRPPERELHALIEYFRARQPRRVSDLNKDQYAELRRGMWEHCLALKDDSKYPHISSEFFVHHMTDGGNEQPSKYNVHISEFFKFCIDGGSGLPLNLPEFTWEECAKKEPYSFDRPPVRALAQFDDWSKDITKCFKCLKAEIEHMSSNKFTFSLAVEKISSDYPWCNISALGYALFCLAKGFEGEVSRYQCTSNSAFMLRVFENVEKNSIILCTEVVQILYPKTSSARFLCLPDRSAQEKPIMDFYRSLDANGFITKKSDCSILISVEGKRDHEYDPWWLS